ncbi:hypothetical protein JXM67_10180 [candidate division WOR-3 bacterium]|nr:hypothetical protein [candidate division WOR-3 bacterium]
MNKKVKGILMGAGIALGVLVIGVSVAYGFLGNPPKLSREVTVLEELLPQDAVSYVVFADIDGIAKLYGRSKMKRLARKLGIEEDFENLEQVRKLNERTNGKFWDILGSRFIYASFDGGAKLLVSQPRWNVRTFFRAVLGRGRQSEAEGLPYAVFAAGSAAAFAGDYFWYANSEKLLLSAIKIAVRNIKEEDAFPRSENNLVYGLTRKRGKHLTFDEFRWSVYKGNYGLEAAFEIERPGGVLGSFIAGIERPSDYTRVPDDAFFFVNLTGVNPGQAWNAAKVLARQEGTEEILVSSGVQKPIVSLAADAGDEVLFLMQGWNVDLWYAPARWVFSAEVSSIESIKAWEVLVPWLFEPSQTDTILRHQDVNYHAVGFGEDLPPIAYLMYNERLTLSSDTALIPWVLDAWSRGKTINNSQKFLDACEAAAIANPIVYLDWPVFKEALKDYLGYAADRSSGFTPADVEAKMFPLLDGLELKAILVDADKDGETLVFTVRTVEE